MNAELRKRAAALLGKSEDDISDADVLDALEASQQREEAGRFDNVLTQARAALTAHVERRAIPSAALDVAMAEIEAAKTAEGREAILNRFDASWKPIPSKTVASAPAGSDGGSEGEEADQIDGLLVGKKVSAHVAELKKTDPDLSPYDMFHAALAKLTKQEREAYEKSEIGVNEFLQGK